MYKYIPLTSRRNIRVLYLEPNKNHTAPIIGELQEEAVDTARPYAALSYTWGPVFDDGSHLTDSISCDGQDFRVTAHLHQGLRRVRQQWDRGNLSPLPKLAIWIDAICINQVDIEERNEQVRLMGEIYTKCSLLVIWLGEPTTAYEREIPSLLESFDSDPVAPMLLSPEEAAVQQKSNDAAQALTSNPWFHRRWIIQESILGSRSPLELTTSIVRTIFGEHLIDLSSASFKRTETASMNFSALDEIMRPGTWRQRHLLANLQTYDGSLCSDDRDRIFALLAISAPDDMAEKLIDYSKSVDETYLEFARLCLEQQRLPQLLACASSRRRSIETPVRLLPSWIPDWRIPVQYTCFEEGRLAGMGGLESQPSVCRVDFDRGTLQVPTIPWPQRLQVGFKWTLEGNEDSKTGSSLERATYLLNYELRELEIGQDDELVVLDGEFRSAEHNAVHIRPDLEEVIDGAVDGVVHLCMLLVRQVDRGYGQPTHELKSAFTFTTRLSTGWERSDMHGLRSVYEDLFRQPPRTVTLV